MRYRPDLYALRSPPLVCLGPLNRPLFPTTVPRMFPGSLRLVCPTPYQPQANLFSAKEGAHREGPIRLSVKIFSSVAEVASREGHDQQRRHPEADHNVGDAAGYGGSGEESVHGHGGRIDGPVRQDGQKHATFGGIEDPREHDCDRHSPDDEQGNVEEAPVWCVPGRYEEQGKMPKAPEGSECDATYQRSVEPLQ